MHPTLTHLVATVTPKTDLATSGSGAAAAVDPMRLVQMAVAVAIVGAGLKWLAPKLLRQAQSKKGTELEVLESADLGGTRVHLLEVRGKAILVGTGQQGPRLIADLGEAKATEDTAEPAFFEMIDAAADHPKPMPTHAVVETEPTPTPEPKAATPKPDDVALIERELERRLRARSGAPAKPEIDPAEAKRRLRRLTG